VLRRRSPPGRSARESRPRRGLPAPARRPRTPRRRRALRDVVDRERAPVQGRTMALPWPLAFREARVQVRDERVEEREHGCPEPESDDDLPDGSLVERRHEQAEDGRCEHDPAGRSEQDVEQAVTGVADEEQEQPAEASAEARSDEPEPGPVVHAAGFSQPVLLPSRGPRAAGVSSNGEHQAAEEAGPDPGTSAPRKPSLPVDDQDADEAARGSRAGWRRGARCSPASRARPDDRPGGDSRRAPPEHGVAEEVAGGEDRLARRATRRVLSRVRVVRVPAFPAQRARRSARAWCRSQPRAEPGRRVSSITARWTSRSGASLLCPLRAPSSSARRTTASRSSSAENVSAWRNSFSA
jgi:hypothetical protein